MARSATQADPSSSDEVFKRALTDYETNSTCTSASRDKNDNHIFLDSVSKLNLIFWVNLDKNTLTPLNGPAIYFITSSKTYLNMIVRNLAASLVRDTKRRRSVQLQRCRERKKN